MSECIFCQIAAKKIPARIVYETDTVVAFHDIKPAAPIHVLVIPRAHYPDLQSQEALQAGIWEDLIQAVQATVKAVGAEDGFRIVINTGAKAGQTIFHLHLHVLAGRDFDEL